MLVKSHEIQSHEHILTYIYKIHFVMHINGWREAACWFLTV